MGTIVKTGFVFGTDPTKDPLPEGWTFEESENEFLKAISPGGVRFFWDGGDILHEELPPLWPGGSLRANESVSLKLIHQNMLIDRERAQKAK